MPTSCHRVLVALVTFALACGVGVATASAGQLPYEVSIAALCNTTTGNYDVTVTITSFLDVETAIDDAAYAFVSNGSGPLVTGDTTYAPNPMPAGGTSQTTVSGPGDSGFVEVGFHIVEIDDSDTVTLELAGDCVAAPATTTSSTAPAPSSTAAGLAVVAPRFTG